MKKRFCVATAAVMALALMCGAFAAAGEQHKIVLTDNGASDYSIVVAKDAIETPKFAARELQAYLEKVCGVKLPIVETPAENGKNIFIGESEFTKNLGLNLDDVAAEGFTVNTVGDALVLMGKDTPGDPLNTHWRSGPQTGTLSAAYDFIEKFLGVRWFLPTETGEYYAPMKKLALGEINLKDEPAFISRVLYVPESDSRSSAGSGRDYRLWQRRQKLGRSLIVQHSHGWYYIIPCHPSPEGWAKWEKKRYPYEDHPEYYALVDGRRVMTHNVATGPIHNGQICTSNPDVQRISAEVALEYFAEKPDVPMFSLSANDGGGYCECDNCRTLDAGGSMSDRLISYYNAVGKLVYEKDPTKYLGAYCYGNYTNPPLRTRPFRNLCLWDVHNGHLFLFTRQTLEERQQRIRQWGKLHDKMFYYTAYHGMGLWDFPVSTRRHLADLIKFTKLSGYKGHHIYGFGCWGGGSLELYIAARSLWDTTLDIEQLLDDHYDKCYGVDAGRLIREYHNLIEEEIRKFAESNIRKLSSTDDLGVLKISSPDLIRPYYANIRGAARALLDTAVELAPEGKQRERAKLVSDNFRLVELTLDALDAYEGVKSKLAMDTALRFKKAVDAREEFLEANKESLAISYSSVRGDDGKYNLPVTAKMADYFLSTKAKRRAIDCASVDNEPSLDGNLDDDCWKTAPVAAQFVQKDDASPAEFATVAKVVYDNDCLYIALECAEPSPEKLLHSVTARDGDVWEENEIELFFDPGRDGKVVFQMVFNSGGTQFDMKYADGKGDKGWNGSWRVKTSTGKEKWLAEIAIPYADLGQKKPLAGDIWATNICRVRKTADGGKVEYSQFAPTFGLFNKPEKFADLIFR
jgi:hypothetical protein